MTDPNALRIFEADHASLAPEPEALPDTEIAPPEPTALAAQLAGKLCHDFVSPSGAIVSGLDLLRDPSAQDMREDAMGLIEASARKLVSMVHFARVAFGAANSAERFDARELEGLVRGMFEHIRGEAVWQVEPQILEKAQARVLLNIAQLAGGALPMGGEAVIEVKVEDGVMLITSTSRGPRSRLKAEVSTGLKGEQLTEGLAGQWIQAFWLSQVVRDAKGELEHEAMEDMVVIRAKLPA